MSVVQVGLEEVLQGLRSSLHSIDVRSVSKRENLGDHHLLTGVRVSSRPLNAVRQRYNELEYRFGLRRTDKFGIAWEALPIAEITRLSAELASSRLTVEDKRFTLNRSIRFRDLKGRVERHQDYVRPWNEEAWPGVYFVSGQRTYSSEEITAIIRGPLGWRSVDEMLDVFLEVRGSGSRQLDFFIYVEMPAKISSARISGRTLKVEVTAEKNLGGIHLFLTRRNWPGQLVVENRELMLERVREDDVFVLFGVERQLEPAGDEDVISLTLAHEQLPEIDELIERVRRLKPQEEKNPLLECLGEFWNFDEWRERIERPFVVPTHRVHVGPQDAFQRSISVLLNLAGFRAIDLGRDDTMYHPVTKVERATVDVLAYHQPAGLLLLGACTVYVPKGEDFEKLLHATEVLRKLFSRESGVRLVPVMFSGQENVSPFRRDASNLGLKLVNAQDLAVLAKLIETGSEERFIRFLTSPLETELRGE